VANFSWGLVTVEESKNHIYCGYNLTSEIKTSKSVVIKFLRLKNKLPMDGCLVSRLPAAGG